MVMREWYGRTLKKNDMDLMESILDKKGVIHEVVSATKHTVTIEAYMSEEELKSVNNIFNWAKKAQALADAIASFLNSMYDFIFNRKGVNRYVA